VNLSSIHSVFFSDQETQQQEIPKRGSYHCKKTPTTNLNRAGTTFYQSAGKFRSRVALGRFATRQAIRTIGKSAFGSENGYGSFPGRKFSFDPDNAGCDRTNGLTFESNGA